MKEIRQQGKFAQHYETAKKQRCIKVTDFAWRRLGELAQAQGTSRNDLFEKMARGEVYSKEVFLFVIHNFIIDKRLEKYGIKGLEEDLKLSPRWYFLLEFEKLIRAEFEEMIKDVDLEI